MQVEDSGDSEKFSENLAVYVGWKFRSYTRTLNLNHTTVKSSKIALE